MTILKIFSIHSLSRRKLGLQQLGLSFRLPSRTNYCLGFTAFIVFTLTFCSVSYLRGFDFDGLHVYGYSGHQIPALMAAGNQRWASMLAKQSQTLDEAVIEYRTRYNLDPPDGFDGWFYYAKSQNVKLMDEYDMLMDSLEPLRQLGPVELRRRTDLLNRAPVDINAIRIRAGGAESSLELVHTAGYRKERTEGLMAMLRPVRHLLASRDWKQFDVVVNELAESRVLGGEWHADALDPESLPRQTISEEIWEKHFFGRRSLIDSVMIACGADSVFTKARPGFVVQGGIDNETKEEAHSFEAQNWLDDMDICNHPELTQVRVRFIAFYL